MNALTNLKNFIGVCSGLQCPIIQWSIGPQPPTKKKKAVKLFFSTKYTS